tara:strand:- start:243 stop:491 length:249 start_codon:yes stop_codon:yes gene_type:complete
MSNEKALAKAAIQKAMNNMKSMLGMIDNSSTTTSGGKTMVSVAPKKREYTVKTKMNPNMSGSLSMDMTTGESVYKPRKTRIF